MANIKATPNYSKRTFTIRKNDSKYRTLVFSREEFNGNLNNTESDWNQFLKSSYYYLVK